MKVKYRTRAEVFAHWVKALRSGKYRQTRSTLKETRGKSAFCCLGVLCDLARKDGGPKWDGSQYMGEGGTLSVRMLEFMGMDADSEDALVTRNDNGKTFNDIAQYIENVLAPAAMERYYENS